MPMLLAANPPISEQTIWFLVGTGGLAILYLLMRPRKRKNSMAMPSFPLARQREVEDQMSNLLVELSNMARQITAQLDTRAAKLELLIKEADEKLAALHNANRFIASVTTENASPDHSRDIDSPELAALSDTRPPVEPIVDPAAASRAPMPIDSRHGDVYSLADEGRSAPEIARLLARPAGEIELILALRAR
jgi:hypothetical protein